VTLFDLLHYMASIRSVSLT